MGGRGHYEFKDFDSCLDLKAFIDKWRKAVGEKEIIELVVRPDVEANGLGVLGPCVHDVSYE